MPNYKSVPGIPKFLSSKMPTDKKTNMKANSYNFVADWAKKGGSLDSATVLLPEFIKHLAESDEEIGKIKSHHIKTTLPFIEEMRNELKNKILQANQAIKKGELKIGKQETDHEDSAEDHED